VENVLFPAFDPVSDFIVTPIVTPADSNVRWGSGQENEGLLVYTADDPPTGTDDYTIVDYGSGQQIKLNSTKWINTIESNALGLLNVDIWED
jgi:hypothetical protein